MFDLVLSLLFKTHTTWIFTFTSDVTDIVSVLWYKKKKYQKITTNMYTTLKHEPF